MKVVIINGKGGCGKDTFVTMCKDVLGAECVYNVSTVDFVKSIAYKCGWDGVKDGKNRKFLSDLKDLLTEWNDVPFKKIQSRINVRAKSFAAVDWVVFVDCREPAEIQKLKERLNATTVLIRRKSVENNETSNHADAEVFEYNYDLTIYNNSDIIHLEDKARKFIEYMKKEEVPHYESRND